MQSKVTLKIKKSFKVTRKRKENRRRRGEREEKSNVKATLSGQALYTIIIAICMNFISFFRMALFLVDTEVAHTLRSFSN